MESQTQSKIYSKVWPLQINPQKKPTMLHIDLQVARALLEHKGKTTPPSPHEYALNHPRHAIRVLGVAHILHGYFEVQATCNRHWQCIKHSP